jgi:hypothetical protein
MVDAFTVFGIAEAGHALGCVEGKPGGVDNIRSLNVFIRSPVFT